MSVRWTGVLLTAVAACITLGCNGKNGSGSGSGTTPTFTLAWSEYPSWSVFDVAHAKKLIHKDQGQLGPLEEKWGVDIVLKQLDYDNCLKQYGNGDVDAVCITNMDVLSPSLSRSSVAVLPTSTSNGADACIVAGIEDLEELKNHKVYGLGSSVSEYCFNRNLELQGKNPADYQFTDKMPEEAASAMQTSPEDTKAIMVWNPFVLDTLRKVNGSKRMFDSSTIKGEIVDMVVVAQASLDKEGGENFACAVIDAFYQVSDMIENADSRDETLVLLAEKFAPDLKVDDMVQIVTETEFYKTPDLGRALYTGDEFKGTMDKVLKFCTDAKMVDRAPTIAYGTGEGDLRFDPTFMQKVQEKK